MVRLTDEMKEDMKKVQIFPFATSSPEGEPNVVPIGMLLLQDDLETVWVIDNFMQKTLDNVKTNANASFYIWSPETAGAYQVKGTVTVETEGADYEKARDFAKNKKKELPAKSLLKMTVTSVFSVRPGPTAGKRVL